MQLYIDESGSINNHDAAHCPYFVIAIIRVKDKQKLQRVYKRFVSSNLQRLHTLDKPKFRRGKLVREGGKMFVGEKFKELKGTQFDAAMKRRFINFFSADSSFEVIFIKIANAKLTDNLCSNTARAFNYPLRLALGYYIKNGILPNEEYDIQLDERNERTETRHFLETYLNTELIMNGTCNGPFSVQYFDSANNKFIQIADVLANWFYSHLQTGAYEEEFQKLKDSGVIRGIFEFPLS